MNDSTSQGQAANPPANPTEPSAAAPATENAAIAGTEIPASDSAGTETPTPPALTLDVPAHPHHHLVHGTIVAVESLIRQLESAAVTEWHDALEHLHQAVARLKDKMAGK